MSLKIITIDIIMVLKGSRLFFTIVVPVNVIQIIVMCAFILYYYTNVFIFTQ